MRPAPLPGSCGSLDLSSFSPMPLQAQRVITMYEVVPHCLRRPATLGQVGSLPLSPLLRKRKERVKPGTEPIAASVLARSDECSWTGLVDEAPSGRQDHAMSCVWCVACSASPMVNGTWCTACGCAGGWMDRWMDVPRRVIHRSVQCRCALHPDLPRRIIRRSVQCLVLL